MHPGDVVRTIALTGAVIGVSVAALVLVGFLPPAAADGPDHELGDVMVTDGAPATEPIAWPNHSSGPDSPVSSGHSPDSESLACPTAATTTGAVQHGSTPPHPRIVELYPNPTTNGNVGEFFVLELPDGTGSENLTITDGHATATVPLSEPAGERPNRSRIAVSMDPSETRHLTDNPVVKLDGHLRLAADGDELTLANASGPIDAVAYDRAPQGERWYRTTAAESAREGSGAVESIAPETGEWWPQGATCLPVMERGPGEVTAFVLPDSPEIPRRVIKEADDRIRLAGYTFTDEEIATALEDAIDRGVEVDILLEAGPVGGTPQQTKTLLDELDEAGATIRVLGGEGARYTFHHPKYAVADDRALVTTENWKPSGIGGDSNRGWGVVVDDGDLAADLAHVFDTDHDGHDTTSWRDHRERTTFVEDDISTGGFSETVGAESIDVDGVELLLAPDNAEDRLVKLLRSAEESILIKQVRIGSPDFVLLEETIDAAREGVEVQILLDDSWYVADENREMAEFIETTADEEDLPIDVRLVDSRGRFERVHAKGIVVDGETAVVGSVNWNENSLRENREVALVLRGTEIAAFYADVFESDWGDDGWPLPIELVVLVAVALVLAALACRRYVRFDSVRPSRTTNRESPPPVTIEPEQSGDAPEGTPEVNDRQDYSKRG